MTGRQTAWTIDEAVRYFADSGLPVNARQLTAIIRALPRLTAIAETPPGGKGGRGHAMYDIGDLMRLHSALAPWL